jgi:Flavodoxins
MKTIIYYFTGTGNSLAVAKEIAKGLENCELVPIAPLAGTAGEIVPSADRVGIVCPVYDMGLPVIVAEFAGKLDLAGSRYVFGIVTMGGAGVSALDQLDSIVKKKNGRTTDAGFAVVMPGNFPPVHRPPEGAERDKILAAAGWQVREIAKKIKNCEPSRPGFSLFSSLVYLITYRLFARSVHESDKKFSVSDACISCGTCAKVCPVHNITMVQGRPAWQHACECCCACLHFCPKEAIDLNSLHGTKGRGRYRHPALKLEDMKVQAGAGNEPPK